MNNHGHAGVFLLRRVVRMDRHVYVGLDDEFVAQHIVPMNMSNGALPFRRGSPAKQLQARAPSPAARYCFAERIVIESHRSSIWIRGDLGWQGERLVTHQHLFPAKVRVEPLASFAGHDMLRCKTFLLGIIL